jgi:hypothetical protein
MTKVIKTKGRKTPPPPLTSQSTHPNTPTYSACTMRGDCVEHRMHRIYT